MNAIEMPASVPSIAARGVCARIVGPTKTPASTMTPMMKAQASPACQASTRVLRLQVHRQHDHEHDDEHVRHARAVRHRRDVGAALPLRELVGEVRVVEVADRQRDAERRQDAAEHDVGRQLDHAQAQAREHDHVEHDVGEQPEEAVPVARDPPPDLACCGSPCCRCVCHVLPFSASMNLFESLTQPKMPPWALIISSAARWNSGKYEPTQSSSTRQS